MRIVKHFHTWSVNEEVLHERLKASMEDMNKEATRRFIRAAQNRVPVLTGAAKGTFLGIARALGLEAELDFTVNSPYVGQEPPGQTVETGRAQGQYSIDIEPQELVLSIGNTLRHYTVWETTPSPRGRGNWQSFPAGLESYLTYVKTQGDKHMKVFKTPGVFKHTKVTV